VRLMSAGHGHETVLLRARSSALSSASASVLATRSSRMLRKCGACVSKRPVMSLARAPAVLRGSRTAVSSGTLARSCASTMSEYGVTGSTSRIGESFATSG
jgi:hypothetical protein